MKMKHELPTKNEPTIGFWIFYVSLMQFWSLKSLKIEPSFHNKDCEKIPNAAYFI
jgi:hypothetical protein